MKGLFLRNVSLSNRSGIGALERIVEWNTPSPPTISLPRQPCFHLSRFHYYPFKRDTNGLTVCIRLGHTVGIFVHPGSIKDYKAFLKTVEGRFATTITSVFFPISAGEQIADVTVRSLKGYQGYLSNQVLTVSRLPSPPFGKC